MADAAAALPSVAIGPVTLTVADLERSVAYYRDIVGLRVLQRSDGGTDLGVEGALLRLREEPDVLPDTESAGLFHLALLVPQRADLAAWVQHAIDDRVPVDGASDHVVSEALYLTDPDGHGIEIYADRPRATWEGLVQESLTTLPLDIPSLLSEADPAAPWEGLPPGTSMGHIHLRVADLPASLAWYRDVLGLELMATYGAQAAFLAAAGYHHHIGINTWRSAGRPLAGPGTARLVEAELVLPDAASRDEVVQRVRIAGGEPVAVTGGWVVEDPNGIRLRLV